MKIRFAVYSAADMFEGVICGKYPVVVASTFEECKHQVLKLIAKLLIGAKFSAHSLRNLDQRIPGWAQRFEIDSNVFVPQAPVKGSN